MPNRISPWNKSKYKKCRWPKDTLRNQRAAFSYLCYLFNVHAAVCNCDISLCAVHLNCHLTEETKEKFDSKILKLLAGKWAGSNEHFTYYSCSNINTKVDTEHMGHLVCRWMSVSLMFTEKTLVKGHRGALYRVKEVALLICRANSELLPAALFLISHLP